MIDNKSINAKISPNLNNETMSSAETQSNRFEMPDSWERIEISGFESDKNKIDQVKYYLTLALNGTDENLHVTDDVIIINNHPEANKNKALLGITINKMLERFENLQAVSF